MRAAFVFGLGIAAVARAALTSGLYSISSDSFPQYLITQDGAKIKAYGANPAIIAQQVWFLVVSNANGMVLASIQNFQTHKFMAAIGGEIVPSCYAFRWVITAPGSNPGLSAAQIASGSTVVAVPDVDKQLVLVAPDGSKTQRWTFVAAMPPPHAYKVWNEALGLYLEQVANAVLGRRASNTSSQIWHVAGTSAGGGRPSLQNAATDKFLRTIDNGTQVAVGVDEFPWTQSLVGGQMALYTHNSTLTVGADETIILSPGTGTQQNQTWVFVPVA